METSRSSLLLLSSTVTLNPNASVLVDTNCVQRLHTLSTRPWRDASKKLLRLEGCPRTALRCLACLLYIMKMMLPSSFDPGTGGSEKLADARKPQAADLKESLLDPNTGHGGTLSKMIVPKESSMTQEQGVGEPPIF